MINQRNLWIFCSVFLWLLAMDLGGAWAFQLGSRRAVKDRIETMDRPERTAELKIDEVLARLKLKPGDVVADIGAGTGVFSYPMARAIGPNGTLFAVEIEQGLLDYINEQARKQEIGNIRTVLGEYDDPKLPVRNVDVAFFHRVLHMIEHRQAYLNAVAKYLKPDGRIVVIERGPEDVTDWMWLKREDVDTWMAAISFYPAEKFGVFDDKWFVVYQRPYGSSVLLKKREAGKD